MSFSNWLAVASAHPCPPAADVCRARQSALACTPSSAQSFLPSRIHPSLHPSLFHMELMFCLFPPAPFRQRQLACCMLAFHSAQCLSLISPVSPTCLLSFTHRHTHTHTHTYVHPNKQFAEFPALLLTRNSFCPQQNHEKHVSMLS